MPDFSRYNSARTEKWCKDCERVLPVARFRVRHKTRRGRRESYISNLCKQCETTHVEFYRQTTAQGVAAEILRRVRYRAVHAVPPLPFDLTREWIQQQLEAQNYRCALTGIELACRVTGREAATCGYQWNAVSVDRIHPALGYTKANVRFVLNIVNLFKHGGDDARMYAVAEALLRSREKAQVAS